MKRITNMQDWLKVIKGNYYYIKWQLKYWDIGIIDFIRMKHNIANCYCNCLTCACVSHCFDNIEGLR